MIEINNLAKGYSLGRVDKKVFSTVAKKVLKGENREIPTLSRTHEKIGAEISLAFVDKEEIKNLNKKFRKKNKPTDVLSFLLNDPPSHKATEGQRKDYLGEIIICPEIVKENAKKYGVSVKGELLKVFVHGILHLCGYDHEKSEKEAEEMEKIQEKYLTKIK